MPWLLYPQGMSLWYSLDKRLVGPRDDLDAMANRKESLPLSEIKPGHLAQGLVSILIKLPCIPPQM